MTEAEAFKIEDWDVLFPGGHLGLYSGTYSVTDGTRVADVTPERIAEVVAWQVREGDSAETNVRLIARLTDGSWAACMAFCDTTGWDCQAGVEWRWAPDEVLIIEQGIDRATRAALGRPLAIDASTSGVIS